MQYSTVHAFLPPQRWNQEETSGTLEVLRAFGVAVFWEMEGVLCNAPTWRIYLLLLAEFRLPCGASGCRSWQNHAVDINASQWYTSDTQVKTFSKNQFRMQHATKNVCCYSGFHLVAVSILIFLLPSHRKNRCCCNSNLSMYPFMVILASTMTDSKLWEGKWSLPTHLQMPWFHSFPFLLIFEWILLVKITTFYQAQH